jgi:uncharacterized protein YcfJ
MAGWKGRAEGIRRGAYAACGGSAAATEAAATHGTNYISRITVQNAASQVLPRCDEVTSVIVVWRRPIRINSSRVAKACICFVTRHGCSL